MLSIENTADQIALVALVFAAVASIISGCNAIWIQRSANTRAEWERTHELIKILYNGPDGSGAWGQRLAVDELVIRKLRKKQIQPILQSALTHFQTEDDSAALVERLRSAIDELNDRKCLW